MSGAALLDPRVGRFSDNFAQQLDRLAFPPSGVSLEALAEKLSRCEPREVPSLLFQAAEAIALPASVIRLEGKPLAVPGIWMSVENHSDCLAAHDGEARGRVLAISRHCWGPSISGRVPVFGEIDHEESPRFNTSALSFTLASSLARDRLTAEATGVARYPTVWIGNAAKRDDETPGGAPFILAHLEGDRIAIVSGLDVLSEVREQIIGGTVWQIDIGSVIHRYSNGVDDRTHFRSQFLEAAARDFARGIDILGAEIDTSRIPAPPVNRITRGVQIETTVGHVDAFGNLKFRLRESELRDSGLSGRLSITINGAQFSGFLDEAIANGTPDALILTVGSSWHGEPRSGATDNFVDTFLRLGDASRLVITDSGPGDAKQHTAGLPEAGDRVLIRAD